MVKCGLKLGLFGGNRGVLGHRGTEAQRSASGCFFDRINMINRMEPIYGQGGYRIDHRFHIRLRQGFGATRRPRSGDFLGVGGNY